jgi:hypothetical protein
MYVRVEVFGSIIAVAFQSAFHWEIYQNNIYIYIYIKNYFLYQHIKTIQKYLKTKLSKKNSNFGEPSFETQYQTRVLSRFQQSYYQVNGSFD